jgi:cobalt/nickel transport system permease protein
MTQKQKRLIALVTGLCIPFILVSGVSAMHIMEGYLAPKYCIAWGVVCIPFVIAGFYSIRKTLMEHRKTLILLAMVGAYSFVISALKIPSVTGSCSHATGTPLGALLFGPSAMAVIGLIILLFQAILLAHGGLTTLGANTFSMAIAGPFIAFAVYKLSLLLKAPRHVAVFLACFLGDLGTYCVTSIQLAIAYPSEVGGFGASLVKFMGIFAATQVPLAIIEGLLSVAIIMALEAYANSELRELKFLGGLAK